MWAISAFALYTRKQLGDLDVAKAKQLIADAGVDKLSMEANGWLLVKPFDMAALANKVREAMAEKRA